MTEGLPVILSDIPPHADLVSGKPHFLYALGNVGQLTTKMGIAVEHYDAYASESLVLSREFSERGFLEDWERLFSSGSAFARTRANVRGSP